MTEAERAIREALARWGREPAFGRETDEWHRLCGAAEIKTLLAELDTLRARCEAADALLRETRDTINGLSEQQAYQDNWFARCVDRIDAHLNQGAGRE